MGESVRERHDTLKGQRGGPGIRQKGSTLYQLTGMDTGFRKRGWSG